MRNGKPAWLSGTTVITQDGRAYSPPEDADGSGELGLEAGLIANLTDVVVALSEPGAVLVADAAKGLIWKLDTINGKYDIIIQDDIFLSSSPEIPLGVDGLHIVDDYLYFTNLGDNILCRVSIDAAGNATDQIELVAMMPAPDDFALAEDGTAHVVGADQLYRVSPWQGGRAGWRRQRHHTGGCHVRTIRSYSGGCWRAVHRLVIWTYAYPSTDVSAGTNRGLLVPTNGRLIGGQILAINVEAFG
ncbi:hypothetical protein LTS10_000463 [Elasticomyces elasticus]|nr:hypothetical protein LTS10_000463 [Elasticomyces elasticus]